ERANALVALRARQEIQLVQHEPARLVLERVGVRAELALDGAIGFGGIPARELRARVDYVQQQARALEMLEEPDPEARALCGALDEPRNVGEHEAAVGPHADDAELRRQRREWIVGDLRARGRERARQRRFARVRRA